MDSRTMIPFPGKWEGSEPPKGIVLGDAPLSYNRSMDRQFLHYLNVAIRNSPAIASIRSIPYVDLRLHALNALRESGEEKIDPASFTAEYIGQIKMTMGQYVYENPKTLHFDFKRFDILRNKWYSEDLELNVDNAFKFLNTFSVIMCRSRKGIPTFNMAAGFLGIDLDSPKPMRTMDFESAMTWFNTLPNGELPKANVDKLISLINSEPEKEPNLFRLLKKE